MKKLIIVESPSKCSKIRKALGPNYIVVASVGHITQLKKRGLAIDLSTWQPEYEISPDKKDIVKNIKEEAKRCDEIYIASDDDIEGEKIAHDVRDIIPKKGKTFYRVIFKTITKPDIVHGIKNPIPFNKSLFEAQRARRIVDRLVGFKVSPVLWGSGLKGTSAGRVQSAALKFLVAREKEIKTFVPSEYWTMKAKLPGFEADFYGVNGKKVVPKTKKEMDFILKDLTKDVVVIDYSKKKRERKPLPPFTTATMQKSAGNKFGWTGKQVMDAAQSLYTKGACSYIRTESVRVEPGKIADVRQRIEADHGKNYLSPKTRAYKNKNQSFDAHEAIRPSFDPSLVGLSQKENKLLDLIIARFMASQMSNAIFDQAAVKLQVTGKSGNLYEFRANGSILKFDGFLKVYGTSTNDTQLPSMSVGDKIKATCFKPNQHETKPPSHFTDPGSFTDKMEKDGIGRPSTYASVIDTLIKRKYVVRNKQKISATEIGIMVSDFLTHHFENVTSSEFTADMESKLDKIALGQFKEKDMLDQFWGQLSAEIKTAKKNAKTPLLSEHDCDKCDDGKMVKKLSASGIFYSCSNYPKCMNTMNIDKDGKLIPGEVKTAHTCPKCEKDILILKSGRFGKYFSCQSDDCNFTTNEKDGMPVKKSIAVDTGKICPRCGKGKLVERNGRYGKWVGCTEYRKGCKYTAKIGEDGSIIEKKTKAKSGKDTGIKCPSCKTGILIERPSKYGKGTWKACNQYPRCKHKE